MIDVFSSDDDATDVFATVTAERFRTGRHESEYFDPDRAAEKTAEDAQWALDRAVNAIDAVTSAFA